MTTFVSLGRWAWTSTSAVSQRPDRPEMGTVTKGDREEAVPMLDRTWWKIRPKKMFGMKIRKV